MNNFLKRFEKLENADAIKEAESGLRLSRRFEILEIGDKKISVAITDKITIHEKAPSEIKYYVLCPYCARDNSVDASHCLNCRQPLKTKFTDDYQIRAKQLKKCTACGAINQLERKSCWVCGKNFPESNTLPRLPDDNVITLSIDGKEYKSTDPALPIDIKILMERIRYEGYKKEVVDDWICNRNCEAQQKKEYLQTHINEVKSEFLYRRNAAFVIGGIILLFFLLKGCLQ